ncbi:hypothetical protein PR048_019941 [Dryococelus australis]|uniref:Tc1-like transposase DDE domain-containing protein n=1 Tax=Dryococelus australis TaxID=614101 RepID=A0ABQ9H4V6_9NEOP|nr:hypothetical protein PR048_019941 [Dryococelus australis]
MQRPAMSPDLNYIEHTWDVLKRATAQRLHPPTTCQEVIEAAVKEWNRLLHDDLDNLICSMARRVRALLDVHSDHILIEMSQCGKMQTLPVRV